MSFVTLSFLFFLSLLLFHLLPPSLAYPTLDSLSPSSSVQKFMNVRNFGARNDGKTDATQAFLNAWDAACSSTIPSILYVPKGAYLLKPLQFEGSYCKTSNILVQIDGTLVLPDDYREAASAQHWIVFHMINGLHIKGGVLDAKGKSLWDCKVASQHCPDGATSLSFDNSKNVVVDGLASINSQMFHITINACEKIKMARMTITADANSPNTDGIHIAQSNGVTILDSIIKTGDDCISIGPNNQNVWIEGIYCGPGHGISIGSLGRDSREYVIVQNVMVKSVTFTGTTNGLRIKTFSTTATGRVKDIFFLGARMNNVQNPIIIDQNYCPHNSCPYGQGSGIQITNVVYKGIHGTSASGKALILDCSPKRPCVGLVLQDIKLRYQNRIPVCECEHAYGKIIGSMQPSRCLGH